jgi:phosphohistidine phosphatase SixA
MKTLKSDIYGQLARTNLLPDDVAAAMLAGHEPSLEEIIMPLLIGALDCEAVISCDPKSTWNERRLARQCLILAFLLAIVVAKE